MALELLWMAKSPEESVGDHIDAMKTVSVAVPNFPRHRFSVTMAAALVVLVASASSGASGKESTMTHPPESGASRIPPPRVPSVFIAVACAFQQSAISSRESGSDPF